MKKLTVLLTVIFMASMSFAQTNVDLDQTGNSSPWWTSEINDATITQTGTNVDADFDQVAGTYNILSSGQSGTDLSITLDATAGTHNDADFKQSGLNGDIDIQQVASSGNNYVQTWQQGGLGYTAEDNDIDVVQTAGTNNFLKQRQSGQDHIVNLEQTAGTYNHAETYQGQWGALETNNVIYGAELGVYGPLYDEDAPATQTSTTSSNHLYVDQDGSYNKVGLYQDGFDYNYAHILQEGGDNGLLIYQTNVDGYNSVISNQTGGNNSATVLQNTYSGSGTITVDQN